MQKHNAAVAAAGRGLCCTDMHIHCLAVFHRKFGQLKIVSSKQSEGLRFVMQMRSNAPGQSQAVKC